ncbi:TPA: hypothetical protein ACHJSF_004130, partial [Escherichia coli]
VSNLNILFIKGQKVVPLCPYVRFRDYQFLMQNAPTRSGLQMSLNLKLMARSCIYRQSWIFIMEK